MHNYGLCLGKSMKYTIQEEIGNNFLDQAVQLVKQRHRFLFVLDNIHWEVKVHDMRSDNQNRSVYAVATSIVFDCVNSDQLLRTVPTTPLANVDFEELLKADVNEVLSTWECYKIFRTPNTVAFTFPASSLRI